MKRSIPLLAALALLPAASARADVTAGTQTATSGTVTATASWSAGVTPTGTTLTITRNGVVAFQQQIPKVCDDTCLRSADDADEFQVRDLDGDGEPEVLIKGSNLDTCCDDGVGIYHYDAATGTYREFFKHFPLIFMERHHNTTIIVTTDTRFGDVERGDDYKVLPVRAFAYAAGPKLVDVTAKDALEEVRSDARLRHYGLVHATHKELDLNRGYAVAYVAEQYLLGKGPAALRLVDRVSARGLLGSPKKVAGLRRRLVSAIHRFGYA